ncbi:hypothetical protein ACFQH3_06730 [Haladaptatus sp. GCM10025707]
MKEISHTNPYTGKSFGEGMVYRRGVVITDGGHDPEREEEPEKMKDVDHEPPNGEGANPVFERGPDVDDDE